MDIELAQALQENAELKEEIAELKRNMKTVVELSGFLEKLYKRKLAQAREIILKLYNAERDVLMCRAEEKAFDNLSTAINDRSIEQFLKEVEP